MSDEPPWAEPPGEPALSECYFYHTVELPRFGLQEGEWDLREGVDAYLGHTAFAGKRVLELGTASGFLCFEMERRGAEVVALDLSPRHDWDIVPFQGLDVGEVLRQRHDHARRLNNAWWLTHRLLGSRARLILGSVYHLPEAIGPVDVTVAGSLLLHLRDPFEALRQAAALTRERIVVTDLVPGFPVLPASPLRRWWTVRRTRRRSRDPTLSFLPRADSGGPIETWWALSPAAVERFLGVLGFGQTCTRFHGQRHTSGELLAYTVVGTRS